jgi:hypothetical protein
MKTVARKRAQEPFMFDPEISGAWLQPFRAFRGKCGGAYILLGLSP